MSKVYGSLNNRIDENKMFCDKIEVGTGMTEYYWSDCKAYEVVKVVNQNNVFVRKLDHKKADNIAMSNNWELVSNPNNPVKEIKKYRGNWCWVNTYTKKSLESWEQRFIPEDIYNKVMKTGKATKYEKANVSFGITEYYYDYSF